MALGFMFFLSIAILAYHCPISIEQVSLVSIIVPYCAFAPKAEATGLRVNLIGIDAAAHPWNQAVIWEGEAVIFEIAHFPALQVLRCLSGIGYLHVLIAFHPGHLAIIEDEADEDLGALGRQNWSLSGWKRRG